MKESINTLKLLLKSKTKCIWIRTYEEQEAMKAIKNILLSEPDISLQLYSWSYFMGLKKEALSKHEKYEDYEIGVGPDILLSRISEMMESGNKKRGGVKNENLWIIKDFHLINDNKQIIRGLRDIVERDNSMAPSYNPIVVISPIVNIPMEHEKLFTIIDFETPNRKEVEAIFTSLVTKLKASNAAADSEVYSIPTEEEVNQCINLALGLTFEEIKAYASRSIKKYKTICKEMFYQARLDLIKKTGILEYKETSSTMDDMGGNHCFKEWISEIKDTFSPEAEAFGVEKSKGFLGLGVPGTSKTLSAEIIAGELGLPLLKFNMSSVMHSHVGQSEKNMENAINIVKSCAPCVLLIDEAEKTLSGTGSSNKTDGGTLMRVVGQLLEFLGGDASKDVFTIMTSNDVSQLPPELTRSGRLDTLWYFGLPTTEERIEIFNIHLSKVKVPVKESLASYAASLTQNFTGAEIKEMVKVAVRKAFKRSRVDGNNMLVEEDIENALPDIIPVYNSSREKIVALEEYSRTRARFANAEDYSSAIESVDDDDISFDDLKI